MSLKKDNFDKKVVEDFGNEWDKFNQSEDKFSLDESNLIFRNYFKIYPVDNLNKNSIVMDLGCGSGRWAKIIAPKVKKLIAVDPSLKALNIAKKNLTNHSNVEFIHGDIESINFEDNYFDFIYSLGVLHHIPDTSKAIKKIYKKLKPSSFFLVYLYYSFDNRPLWFKLIWQISNIIRIIISNLPNTLKKIICDILALIIYLPLSLLSKFLSKFKINTDHIPLSFYKDKSFYTMRTDSLDRFGTKLEKRFSLIEIKEILKDAKFENIINSNDTPFWCVLGHKKSIK